MNWIADSLQKMNQTADQSQKMIQITDHNQHKKVIRMDFHGLFSFFSTNNSKISTSLKSCDIDD